MTDDLRLLDALGRGRRRLLAVALTGMLVLAQLLLGAANPAGACACGVFFDPVDQRTDAGVLRESAILSLDDGVETIIMGLALDGTRTGSTLLMPTPSVPEVSAASSGTPREMQTATAPREEVEYDLWGDNPFLAGSGAPEGALRREVRASQCTSSPGWGTTTSLCSRAAPTRCGPGSTRTATR
ncbi:DUF2330 domain-containing protein [Brachybacterium sp. GPGPB12]|uniref:DUF2330 domain-containing protein n=1 Tax=Brachybacterium sp. GPGPB12 TaxID=3023517 RepID=UPI0031343A51